jgi:hypothetical protein
MSDDLARTLGAAVTTYDRKEEDRARRSKRGYHNRYALGQYLLRVDEVVADVAAGSTPRAAIVAGFTGRLADTLLRAIGEPATTDAERRGGIEGYVPASDR